MSTTSDAVHVAAATSSSSTGDVATVLSPSTATGGRSAAAASNWRASRQRMVISPTFAPTPVAPPPLQPHAQPVVAEPTPALVPEQPAAPGTIMQLPAD